MVPEVLHREDSEEKSTLLCAQAFIAFHKHSLPFMIWKFIRKFLNVVVGPCIPFNRLGTLIYRFVGYPIGKNVFIGMRCYLDDTHPALIPFEDNVVLSYSIVFAARGRTRDGYANTPIVVKKGGYVGCAAVLLGGAVVGEERSWPPVL